MEAEELQEAIKFMGVPGDKVEEVRKEYFRGNKILDMSVINSAPRRYYHTNGLCAMILCIQDDITKSKIENT